MKKTINQTIQYYNDVTPNDLEFVQNNETGAFMVFKSKGEGFLYAVDVSYNNKEVSYNGKKVRLRKLTIHEQTTAPTKK